MTTILDHDGIALRAYFIWEGEGRPHGRHEAHWFAAQVAETLSAPEVRASVPAEAAPTKAAPAKAAARKPATAKKAAPAKAEAPKAPAEAVVAAAALAAPRAARTVKGARGAH